MDKEMIEVLTFLSGLTAFGIGFWRMYFTARSGGLKTWVVGAILFWFGAIASIFGGMMVLIHG